MLLCMCVSIWVISLNLSSSYLTFFSFVSIYWWAHKRYSSFLIVKSSSLLSSVQSLIHVQLFAMPWTAAHQPSLSITNSQSLLHPTISPSVVSFSSCLQSFPASRFFPMSQCFASGGQSIGVSTSASVLPVNVQDWFPLGWTGWISLQSMGLSRIFSNTTVRKHQFFFCFDIFFSSKSLMPFNCFLSKMLSAKKSILIYTFVQFYIMCLFSLAAIKNSFVAVVEFLTVWLCCV